jgi:hypothetical protein
MPAMRSLVPALVVFVLAVPVFSRIAGSARGPFRSDDHWQHMGLAVDLMHGKAAPPHPLFHIVLLALIGGDNWPAAPGMLAFVLATALGVRAGVTAGILREARDLSTATVTFFCLVLALAMPLPNWWGGDIYQGNVSPNVWHNPTGVFAMPFAVGSFLLGTRTLARPGFRDAAWMGIVMLLCLLAKPNYVLAFGPCFAVAFAGAVAKRVREGKLSAGSALGLMIVSLGPALGVLAIQVALITRQEHILYAPFAVWGVYSREHILGSILIGVAFPLTVLVCFPKKVNASPSVVLAWATLAVAMATFALFAESGDRITNANFAWGMTLADHVLFVASTALVLGQPGVLRRSACLSVLGLHALSGALALRLYCG